MSYTKSIRVNKELFNQNEKKKNKRTKSRRQLVSPDQIQSLLSKRKKTLKKSNIPKDNNLQDRQKLIHEQIMKADNFKDLYKQLYENKSVNNIYEDLNKNEDVNNVYEDLEKNDDVNNVYEDLNKNEDLDKNEDLNKNEDFDTNNINDVNYNNDNENQNNMYDEIVNVTKLKEPIKEKKVDFYAKSPKKNRKQRFNPKKTKISTSKRKSKTKTKKYSPQLIDKYFLEINNHSNKKINIIKKKKKLFLN